MSNTDTDEIKQFLGLLSKGHKLTSSEIFTLLQVLSKEDAKSDQKAAFLMALSLRGETEEELLGAAEFIKSQMLSVKLPPDCVDIVGTGGDGHHTYNVSTAAAFVAAGAGAKVAKHGNRSITSLSGATDVLSSLGLRIDLPQEQILSILNEHGLCFLWAQGHHPILKSWGPIRSNLGIRSIFNLIGPLCNPGNVRRQVLGVYHPKWIYPLANVLKSLGSVHSWIVCGHDGLDELSTTGPSQVLEIKNNCISEFVIHPEELHFNKAVLQDLVGGSPKTNANELIAVLKGKNCAYRDIVILNAGALLVVAGIAPDIIKGIELASISIDKGYALDKLNQLIISTNK